MSDSPSASLVKMTAARVTELAQATLDWANDGFTKEREPFEQEIAEEIERRKGMSKRWRRLFGLEPNRENVIQSFSVTWGFKYAYAGSEYLSFQEIARQLLLAAKESSDGFVWVTVEDLESISFDEE